MKLPIKPRMIKTVPILLLFAVCLVLITTVDTVECRIESTKSEVITDAANKYNIRGLITVVPVRASQARNDDTNILKGLIECLIKYTGIEAKIDQSINLDSPRLLQYPFIYVNTGQSLDLTVSEKNNIQKYLTSGGFMVFEFSYQAFPGLKQYLPGNARLKTIPREHTLYHIFYEIEDSFFDGNIVERRSGDLTIGPYLMGIWFGDKLVGVYSDKRLGDEWELYWIRKGGADSRMRMGINMIMFALLG